MAGESYFIKVDGKEHEAVRKALQWVIGAKSAKAFLAINGLGDLDGLLKDVLGERVARSLKSDGRIIISGTEISIVTPRKKIHNGSNAPMVAVYPEGKFLDELDSIPDLSALIVVPWTMEEAGGWIRARSAVELATGERPQPTQLVSNRVVERALKSLSDSANVSTGVVHPRDRNRAIQTFKILRDGGESFTPEEVKAWLIVNGKWQAPDAEDAAELVRQVLAGKRLRSEHAWAPNILEIWREQADKVSQTD